MGGPGVTKGGGVGGASVTCRVPGWLDGDAGGGHVEIDVARVCAREDDKTALRESLGESVLCVKSPFWCFCPTAPFILENDLFFLFIFHWNLEG